MARPQRSPRQRVRLMPEVEVPPGQPVPPGSGSRSTATTMPRTSPTTVQPELGPTVPPTTTTLVPPATTPGSNPTIARDPQALQNMAAFADELANVTQVQLADSRTYSSRPLGFEAAVSDVLIPVQTPQLLNGQIQRDAQGNIIMTQATDIRGNPMFDTVYELDPQFLPPDPWFVASQQVAREVMTSTSTDPYAFLETPAAQRMAALGGSQRGQFKLATEESIDKDFMTMTLDELNQVKFDMLRTGLISLEDIGDPTSRGVSLTIRNKARDAARLANFDGLDWKDFLSFKGSEGANLGTEKETMRLQPLPTIRVTSDADLRYVLNDTALKYLGRQLADDEIMPLVQNIQREQETMQRQAFAGQGGVVQDMPTVAVQAMEEIQEELRPEYDVFQMGNVLDMFSRAVRGTA